MTIKNKKTVPQSDTKDTQDISTETLKTLMSISCAFAGLCFAILALTIKSSLNSYTALQLILWLAVIAFACSGLRSADKLLDLLCTKTRAFPNSKFPLVVLDNRVKDSGNAAFYFFAGWALLAAAMFFLGWEIQLPLWLVILGTGYMGFIDILFITHKFARWS
jgi:hypothetical protein